MRAAPAVGPKPGMTLSTPGGNPASLASSAIYKQVSGVCSAGFTMTQFPVDQHTQQSFFLCLKIGQNKRTRCQCRCDFPAKHEEREVPRNNLGADSNWLVAGERNVVAIHGHHLSVVLVCPAGIIPEDLNGGGHIHGQRAGEGLAIVQSFQALKNSQ